MARNKGTFQFAANFEVKAAAALDPRVVVATKAELITKETWPYDGDTIYLYKGIMVAVQEEQAVYMLVDTAKILSTDYSGWLRVDAGNAKQVEVIDNLESDAADKALSAKQGKALMGEISGVKEKLVNIYTYKGSKDKYTELPTDAAPGDVWNVAEAYNGHAAGTNWAWTGTEWDPLAGSVDLSNYYDKTQVDNAIKEVTDAAAEESQRIEGLIQANTTLATEAKGMATDNKASLDSLSVAVGNINLVLNGNDDDTDDIPNQIGLVGRLAAVEENNNSQDTRLTNLEKLVSGGEAGEGGTTLLEMVNANTTAIENLTPRVKANEDAIATLNEDSNKEGSVDFKIKQAFSWIDV